jgi:hypothetical protein
VPGPSLVCETPTRSRRSTKTDIEYVHDRDVDDLAQMALEMRLARYRYKDEPEDARLRLGFLIDDQPDPSPAVLEDRAHVDLYGYTSLLLATVQHQEKEIRTLQERLASLERQGREGAVRCDSELATSLPQGEDVNAVGAPSSGTRSTWSWARRRDSRCNRRNGTGWHKQPLNFHGLANGTVRAPRRLAMSTVDRIPAGDGVAMTDFTAFGSIGGGARRAIPWADLGAETLGDEGRRAVGATWLERMKQEHLAVGAFALLARELAEQGCDPVVLSLVTRASCDEVRHAEICRRFAVALLGPESVPASFRGLPKVPMHPDAPPSDRVLFHVVEMCCMSETLTGVYFTEMLARTTDAVAREAIESLLEDEIDHGRVGWAYLAERARERTTGDLAAALPAMLERTFHVVLGRAGDRGAARDDDAKLESCGYLGPRAAADVYARALHDVILPGFEQLGVELGPAQALLRERRWLR